jgi:hypothetical protein
MKKGITATTGRSTRGVVRDREVVRKLFRLGWIEVGPGYVRYWNRTAGGMVRLNVAQERRWRAWMARRI